jgi:DNA-binding transcriptional ArsR family regulator
MDTNTLTQEVTALHADICGALADPRRILLLYALSGKSCNVGDLAQQLGISQPATSRHLKILRERGLVLSAREGVNVEYRLADPRLIEALDLLRGVLRDHLAYRASLVE